MKVVVRCYVLDAVAFFAAGYFAGRYLESKKSNKVVSGEYKQTSKGKAITYQNGKLIFDLKR